MSSPAPWADVRAAIVADGLGGVPIRWPAEPWTLPRPPAMWVSIDMAADVAAPLEIGAAGWQERGSVYATIMVPQGHGTDAARVLAKRLVDLLRLRTGNPVVYDSASIGTSDPDTDDGAWWRLMVTIDYRYQDIPVS